MEQTQSNFLNMTGTVIATLQKDVTLWEGEPEVKEVVNEVQKGYNAVISKSDLVSGMDKTGHTTAKDNVLDTICALTHKLCRKMTAYAKTRKDVVLLAKVDLSYSAISRGPELDVISRCAGLIDLAESRLNDFKSFKVTQDDLNAIRQLFKDYGVHIGNRNTISNDKSETGKEIDMLISLLRVKLDTLDDLVEGLLEDDAFIARYKAARNIMDYGKGKTLKNKDKNKDANSE